jgi:hypothetical protein
MAAPEKPSPSPFIRTVTELRAGAYTHTQIGESVAEAVLLATLSQDLVGVQNWNSSIVVIVSKQSVFIPDRNPPTVVEGYVLNADSADVVIQCGPDEAEEAASKVIEEANRLKKPALLFLYVVDDGGTSFLGCSPMQALGPRGIRLHRMRVTHVGQTPDKYLVRMLEKANKDACEGGHHLTVVRNPRSAAQ